VIRAFRRRFSFCSWVFNVTGLRYHSHFARHPALLSGETAMATKLLTNGRNESLVSLHWVLRKVQQCKRRSLATTFNRWGGFAQFSCRPSQRRAPGYKWRRLIENFFGKLNEFHANRPPRRADPGGQRRVDLTRWLNRRRMAGICVRDAGGRGDPEQSD
jgi:hypothetical protein